LHGVKFLANRFARIVAASVSVQIVQNVILYI